MYRVQRRYPDGPWRTVYSSQDQGHLKLITESHQELCRMAKSRIEWRLIDDSDMEFKPRRRIHLRQPPLIQLQLFCILGIIGSLAVLWMLWKLTSGR